MKLPAVRTHQSPSSGRKARAVPSLRSRMESAPVTRVAPSRGLASGGAQVAEKRVIQRLPSGGTPICVAISAARDSPVSASQVRTALRPGTRWVRIWTPLVLK